MYRSWGRSVESPVSMLLRSPSAAAQSLASKPMAALEVALAPEFLWGLRAITRPIARFPATTSQT